MKFFENLIFWEFRTEIFCLKMAFHHVKISDSQTPNFLYLVQSLDLFRGCYLMISILEFFHLNLSSSRSKLSPEMCSELSNCTLYCTLSILYHVTVIYLVQYSQYPTILYYLQPPDLVMQPVCNLFETFSEPIWYPV